MFQTGRRAMIARTAWWLLPVTLLVYAAVRYRLDTPASLALAQLIYLAPLLLACAFTLSSAWAAPPRSRAKAVWALLALAMALLFISESAYSWYTVSGDDREFILLVFDVANVAALLAMLAVLATMASFDRLGVVRGARLILDICALLTLGFSALFRFWVAGLVGHSQLDDALRMTAYALAGMLVMGAVLYVGARMGPVRERPWGFAVVLGAFVYSIGMLMWPLWSLAVTGARPALLAEAATSMLFLAGYYLTFIAGLTRMLWAHEPWTRVLVRFDTSPPPWPGLALSVLVLASVAALGWGALTAPVGSATELVYLASLTLATACLVSRTALSAFEGVSASRRARVDPVLRVASPSSFDEMLAVRFAAARRFGEAFMLALIEIDGFSHMRAAVSLSRSDAVRGAVIQAVSRSLPPGGTVFRVESDRLGVLAPVPDRERAAEVASAIARAASVTTEDGAYLEAAVGWAVCPDDALERSVLLDRARGALAWTVRHGRGGATGYDERVDRALLAEDRIKRGGDDPRGGLTRALVAAADAHDPAHHVHAHNVASTARLVAEGLGMDPDHVERVQIAGLLHDVGKLAVPTSSSGLTSARALAALAEHSELGERMVASLGIEGVAAWIRAHHERWDGLGYPDALAGEDIPVEARVLALADAYDSMTSLNRPGGALSRSAALQEIDLGIGARFDPQLAETFILLVSGTSALGWSDSAVRR